MNKKLFFKGLLKNMLLLLTGVAVLLQTFDRGLLLSGFYLNQQYIATELCENKNEIQLECEGTCVLRKALEKLEDEKSKDSTPKELKIEVLICQSNEAFSIRLQIPIDREYLFPIGYLDYASQDIPGLLKPPTLPMA